MNVTKLFLVFVIILVEFSCLTGKAQAQSIAPKITISPPKFDIVVTPGKPIQETVTMTNESTVPLPFSFESSDFSPKDANGDVDFSHSITGHSGKSWLKANPTSLLLAPQEKKEVQITITAPDATTPGSYFAAMLFEAQLPPNYYDADAQAKVVPWMAALFLMRVGDIPPLDSTALSVKQFVVPRVFSGKDIPIYLLLANNTEFHLTPKTELGLQDYRGGLRSKVSVDDTIMPGSTRLVKAKLTKTGFLGIYRAVATISLNNYAKKIKSKPILIFTWLSFIWIFGLPILMLSAVLHSQRIKHALRAIFLHHP